MEQNVNKGANILIADGGGTKILWACANRDTKTRKFIETSGVNAYFFTEDQIHNMLKEELYAKLDEKEISEIYYYGAGCSDTKNAEKIKNSIQRLYPDAKIFIDTDIIGTAKGACGKNKGIACILGTGSGACVFDGSKVIANREGLGYAMGDEAGGAHLGKLVLKNYLFGHFDKELREKFIQRFGELTRQQILENVYKKEAPNKYFAQFSYFISENRGNPLIEKILKQSIEEFIEISLVGLTEEKDIPVNFTGTVACVFQETITELLKKWGFTPGKFLKNPIEGLVEYHLNN